MTHRLMLCFMLAGCASLEPAPEKVRWWNLDACALSSTPLVNFERADGTRIAISRGNCQRAKVAAAKIQERADIKLWRIYVIDQDSINAFANFQYNVDPYVVLHFGMLRVLGTDEDAWAALMGHEIAHLVRRHGSGRQDAQTQASVGGNIVANVVSAFVPGVGGVVAGTVTGSATQMAMYGSYTRPQEAEADQLGLKWMVEAGYDPRGMTRLFQILAGESSLPAFLSTHPGAEDRGKLVEDFIRKNPARQP